MAKMTAFNNAGGVKKDDNRTENESSQNLKAVQAFGNAPINKSTEEIHPKEEIFSEFKEVTKGEPEKDVVDEHIVVSSADCESVLIDSETDIEETIPTIRSVQRRLKRDANTSSTNAEESITKREVNKKQINDSTRVTQVELNEQHTEKQKNKKTLKMAESGTDADGDQGSFANSDIDNIMSAESGITKVFRDLNEKRKEFDEHPVQSMANIFSGLMMHSLRNHGLKKIVKNNQHVISGDFEFIKSGSTLMLYKYNGSNVNVKVPATVGNLPVVTIHPDAFTVDWLHGGIFKSFSGSAIKAAYKGDTIDAIKDFNLFSVIKGIQTIELPNTITTIFEKTFSNCKSLTVLVIPESVTAFPNDAIISSGIKKVIFNGEIPKDFDASKFEGVVWVRQ